MKMLQEASRPWSIKQRIAGRHGHLSNTEAADAAQEIMSAEIRHVYLGHLSRECNSPELAQRVFAELLQKIDARHVQFEVTSQNTACPTLTLARRAIAAAYVQHSLF